MEECIINNKTIAILKTNNHVIIFNVDNYLIINKSIKRVIDSNCNYYGSSLEGRKNSAKKILQIKNKIPILIEEENGLILLQLNSMRSKSSLFLMSNKIIDYKISQNKLVIRCVNNYVFYVNLTKYSFEKILLNAIKLNNQLKWRKMINFV